MRFWDSSAIVPLVIQETVTEKARDLYREDPRLVTWLLSPVEVVSALCRREREGALKRNQRTLAEARLDRLIAPSTRVIDVELVAHRARRLLALHPVRAADALQLAAALIACEERPELLPFVTFDERLSDAANREGFVVIPDNASS